VTQRVAATIVLALGVLSAGRGYAPAARAHDSATTVFAAITVDGAMVRFGLTLSSLPDAPFFAVMKNDTSRDPRTYAALSEAIAERVRVLSGGEACRPGRRHIEPPTPISASISATVDYVCPGPVRSLELTNDLFDVFGGDLHMIGRIDWGSDSHEFTFGPDERHLARSHGAAVQAAPNAGGGGWIIIAAAAFAVAAIAGLGFYFRRRPAR